MTEEWRQIPDWPNHEASNLGHFRKLACSNRPAHDLVVNVQYYSSKTASENFSPSLPPPYRRTFISLHDSGRAAKISAARLILFTFVGPPPDDRRNKARHIDDNVENNRLDNLIWGTQKENIQDAVRNGRRTTYGEFVKSGKLTQIEIEFIRDNCTPWSRKNGVRALANRYNVHESTIYNIIHNLTWQQAAQ